MKRYRQSLDEILEQLSPVGASWRDEHADCVIKNLESLPIKSVYTRDDLIGMFQLERTSRRDFDAALTVIRLFLDVSKDEFTAELRDRCGKGQGVKKAQADPDLFFSTLEEMGVLERMAAAVNRPITWMDLLIERLKGGAAAPSRGSVGGGCWKISSSA